MLASRGKHNVGDYINPLCDHDDDGTYYREVLRITTRHDSGSPFGADAYDAVDAHGKTYFVMKANDPRLADDEQVDWFESGKLECDRPLPDGSPR